MRQIAEDRELDWHPRSHAVQCVVADASERASARLEDALDWLLRASAAIGAGSQKPESRICTVRTTDHRYGKGSPFNYPQDDHGTRIK